MRRNRDSRGWKRRGSGLLEPVGAEKPARGDWMLRRVATVPQEPRGVLQARHRAASPLRRAFRGLLPRKEAARLQPNRRRA